MKKYIVGLVCALVVAGILIWANNQTTTVTSNGENSMKIETTKEGSGEEIKNGQTASMLYTGKLDDGTIFDTTANRGNEPFKFVLGAGEVISGWDEGVLGMKVGEERTLVIPSEKAYGAYGIPPVIPPNATLTFDVTLLSIE